MTPEAWAVARAALNSFIEDTSVLVAAAYLLTRGRFVRLFDAGAASDEGAARGFQVVTLGGAILLIVAAGGLVPEARYPYVSAGLAVLLAAFAGGRVTGAFVAAGTVLLALFLPGWQAQTAALPRLLSALAETLPALACGVGARYVLLARFADPRRAYRETLLPAFVIGALAQAASVAASLLFARAGVHVWLSVPANGLGFALLLLVIREARVRDAARADRTEAERARAAAEAARAEAEHSNAEAERARALALEAQLSALRARIHPHFLFNCLSAIAALCGFAPDKAEAMTVSLGQMMRRALESDTSLAPLDAELRSLEAYRAIADLRLGGRVTLACEVGAGAGDAPVPQFALLTLVENAVEHGIVPSDTRAGNVWVRARRQSGWVRVSVRDNGAGMDAERLRRVRAHGAVEPSSRLHGLQIVDAQLRLRFGDAARLRVFSRLDGGSLVVFQVPGANAL